MKFRTLVTMLVAAGAATLAGCGGGGGAAAPTTTVSGVASKGPLNAATVQVFAIDSAGVQGTTPLAEVKTGADGRYSANLGSYQGAVLVQVRGGTYRDEADPTQTKDLLVEAPGGMRAVVASVSTGNSTVTVTPFTELAARKIKGSGATFPVAAISQGNADIASFFQLPDIISTLPANAIDAASGSASLDAKKYAVALASVAQILSSTGDGVNELEDLFADFGAEVIATGGLSVDAVLAINTATQEFLASANNKTGLTLDAVPAIKPTGGIIKLSTASLEPLAAGSALGAIDLTVTLPAGVTLKADSFGQTSTGVVLASGASAGGSAENNSTISMAKFTAASGTAPATVRVVLANPAGFGLGEFLTINCDLDPAAALPTAAGFSLGSIQITDAQSAALPGVSASLASFAVVLR